ncbi:MAG TPA: STAS domain-containing protein [Candidatus Methylacidiphilales bacterium]|nr:STAS domain-containing protein [Candidatus Methylacidiphilales bacterium]
MSKILVARSGDLGFVKVVGRGSFQNSGCLKAFYLQLLKEGVTRFIIDLGACTYLDSTFLGILLGLGLKLRESGKGLLNILNASSRNLELLRNLGLDRLIQLSGGSLPGDVKPSSGNAPGEGPDAAGKTAPLSPPDGNGKGSAAINLAGVKEENLEEVPCPVPTRAEAAPTILEAHEALMKFDPRNVPKFKDVVEFLREDLGQTAKS